MSGYKFRARLLTVAAVCAAMTACGDKERRYEEAAALLNSEQYREAANAFQSLSSYKDSEEMFERSQNEFDYASARDFMVIKDFTSAHAFFDKLGDFRDSAKLRLECESEITYEEAELYFEEELYEEAAEQYEKIKGFRDSEKKLAIIDRLITPESKPSFETLGIDARSALSPDGSSKDSFLVTCVTNDGEEFTLDGEKMDDWFYDCEYVSHDARNILAVKVIVSRDGVLYACVIEQGAFFYYTEEDGQKKILFDEGKMVKT
ncbi:MAG: hypothetical protein LBL35_06975 [Clostridiales bacterium]|jgi:tetratricopeptide (TPR) repeat protein|nr:hypothetical protein [Clostridiales bacterium]